MTTVETSDLAITASTEVSAVYRRIIRRKATRGFFSLLRQFSR